MGLQEPCFGLECLDFKMLGVSAKTLQRWDREGILKANRTPTDRRYYTYDQYIQFKGINTEDDKRQVVIYARVSTRNQKDDLLFL